ncbi:MAG: DUF2892 domain-containing protein [Crocinitomicaceae bacterium]|nr:DUF2892 domain-containing protein [Crocinitomicaceae bacterium]
MNNNISTADRVIRFILFTLAIVAFILEWIDGVYAYVLIGLGTVFLLTSLLSFCPIYRVFGWNSARKKKP